MSYKIENFVPKHEGSIKEIFDRCRRESIGVLVRPWTARDSDEADKLKKRGFAVITYYSKDSLTGLKAQDRQQILKQGGAIFLNYKIEQAIYAEADLKFTDSLLRCIMPD